MKFEGILFCIYLGLIITYILITLRLRKLQSTNEKINVIIVKRFETVKNLDQLRALEGIENEQTGLSTMDEKEEVEKKENWSKAVKENTEKMT